MTEDERKRKWATASPVEIIADLNEIMHTATMDAFEGRVSVRELWPTPPKTYERIMRRLRREAHRIRRRERMKRKRRRGWA